MSLHTLSTLACAVLFGSIIVGGIFLWCFTIMKAGYEFVQFIKGERPAKEEPKKTFKKREPGHADNLVPEASSREERAAAVPTAVALSKQADESDDVDAVDAYDEIMASERAAATSRVMSAEKPEVSLEDRLVTEFEAQEVAA